MRKSVAPILATLAACGACSLGEPPPGAGAATSPAIPAADAQTTRVVQAANAFLATLTDAQKKSALFAYGDAEQRRRWTNFPVTMVPRAGLSRGDMNETQRAALDTLLATVLSPTGMKMVDEQMAADDVLKNQSRGGRGPTFGSEYYYIAFLGTPSATSPWMLQFGGHHLGINATIVGPNITLAPSLTGGQPLTFTRADRTVYIVEREVLESVAMLNSLTPQQRSKAVVSDRRVDLVLGPGHDGQVLQPEGLPGSEMTEAQKARFVALIEARLAILNADDLAATMTAVRRNLDQTYFAWFGPTTAGAGYFRVSGPTLALEFSPQGGDPLQHAHNMYRDPTNDYGAAWAALR